MNILVTGGAGFIGSHTCKALFKAGFTPFVVDNLSLGHADAVKWGEFIKGDISDIAFMRGVLARVKPLAVIHFASSIFVGESVSDPAKYFMNNITGSLNLLESMRLEGVSNIVFSSTAAVFGLPKSIPIKEDDAKAPINPYGFSKYVIENVLRDYHKAYGLSSIALRYFNAAGADLEEEIGERHNPETHLIPLALMAAFGTGKPLNIMGNDYNTLDGTCIRDYVHVADLASAHVLALKRLLSQPTCDAFNLGLGQGFSVKQIVESVARVTGLSVPHSYGTRREGDPPSLVTDNTKAREVLGWQPQVTEIDAIVKSAAKWFRA